MLPTTLRVLAGAVLLAGAGSVAAADGAGEPPSAPSRQRSVEEFVAAQGTFCTPDWYNGGCLLFAPPVQNFFVWRQGDPLRCAMVDYAGVANRWLQATSGAAVDLGTQVTGSITERFYGEWYGVRYSEYHVRLHTTNALAWVVDGCNPAVGTLLFGRRAPDVLAGGAAALAEAHLDVRYVDYEGAPLPDIVQISDYPHPGQGLMSAASRASAEGELRAAAGVPDGTPGQAHLTLAVLFFTNATTGSAMPDFVPVDRVDLNATGH